jgi:hypothetical protein
MECLLFAAPHPSYLSLGTRHYTQDLGATVLYQNIKIDLDNPKFFSDRVSSNASRKF